VAPPKDNALTKEILANVTNKGKDILAPKKVSVPFPERLKDNKKDKEFASLFYLSKDLIEGIKYALSVVNLIEDCFVIVLKKLPPKLKDQLMDPRCKHKYNEPQPTNISLQLANRTITHPLGIASNALVKVGEFIFHVDFVIVNMEEEEEG
ncbi:hypothetical protein CR513_00930, partial [Mucuna pruriens]